MESSHEGLQVLYQRAWVFLCKNLGASEAEMGERGGWEEEDGEELDVLERET